MLRPLRRMLAKPGTRACGPGWKGAGGGGACRAEAGPRGAKRTPGGPHAGHVPHGPGTN